MEGLRKIDKEIFTLVNQVRQDPKSFVPQIEKVLAQLDGDVIRREGKTNIRTNEGAKAVKEAIEYLKKAPAVDAVRWSPELAQSCSLHVEDIGPKGLMQHESSQGQTVKDRI